MQAGLAIAALILGGIGILFFGFVLGPLALLLSLYPLFVAIKSKKNIPLSAASLIVAIVSCATSPVLYAIVLGLLGFSPIHLDAKNKLPIKIEVTQKAPVNTAAAQLPPVQPATAQTPAAIPAAPTPATPAVQIQTAQTTTPGAPTAAASAPNSIDEATPGTIPTALTTAMTPAAQPALVTSPASTPTVTMQPNLSSAPATPSAASDDTGFVPPVSMQVTAPQPTTPQPAQPPSSSPVAQPSAPLTMPHLSGNAASMQNPVLPITRPASNAPSAVTAEPAPVPVDTLAAANAPTAPHGCAVIGGSSNGLCFDYPTWTNGYGWTPPPGVKVLHVLVVGGGGGGMGGITQGIGGPAGGSGLAVTQTILANTQPVAVTVGAGGLASPGFMRPAADGGGSAFGTIAAHGGFGGNVSAGGAGANGGGGSGGGNYEKGQHGGHGGDGATGGTASYNGDPSSDAYPVAGSKGGVSYGYPAFDFKKVKIDFGKGGTGGNYGTDHQGFCGGGGGGGGGLLINNTGPMAYSGIILANPTPDRATSGSGGQGYGAGGGGGANTGLNPPPDIYGMTGGGNGAPGVIYIEW